ncbi:MULTISPECIES: winged helix DNA-binding protein [Sphingomonas]|uniref:winged helix DNA-binding protein n=1 Tax=Sphingomonas TaxID=13687 RepID=UPI0020C17DF6|nr:winged helix DNA-binding protein [Sphingomonas faeni]MCK8456714.1 winged helix DNA-binding protein [Sphingomonas faeni]
MNHALSTAPVLAPLIAPPGSQIVAMPISLPRNVGHPTLPSQAILVQVARRLYEVRQLRDTLLGGTLFSEPAWDILLDLFISDHEGRRLSVSAVCIGARSPSATALRYLSILQDAGLVERTRDERDGRRSHVQLTVSGQRRMATLLSRLTTP